MSLRGTKRATMRGDEPGTSKRRRTEPDDALWQLRPVSDLKMSSIYNRSASEAPAELFRKDLISAMKLPDSEPLAQSEYWIITDTWKQDWERGVQVPVNPDSLPAPKVKEIENPKPPNFVEFKLPKDKYIHLTRDSHYQPDKHQVSTTPARAEAACSYDLDAIDTSWLKLLNAERARAGALPINEDQFERVIEELEVRTWDKIQSIMKSEEGLGIEYDENVICDVCRSPDSEDGNEMVFCDSCNICVHQACYGITVIPDGQWLCRPCGDGVRPTCVLCPNQGGAMKCTPSGHKWAHVSCVLWIPEVSIGCAEKMEPITKISSIPASRWSLVCVLCRERKGACIQCSVKTCKTAYHVTCAFKHGLEMRAIIEDENADDGVKLRSYCQKHSVNNKKEKAPTATGSGSEEEEVKRKRRKDMTSEEKTQARAARLQEIEREFYKHVSVKDITSHILDVDHDAIVYIHNYWQIKRRAGHNRPLLPPKSDDNELLTHRQEQADLDKMKMFVQLRQDLERVRNLCYMVSRREKLSRSFFRMREQTFHKQLAVLTADPNIKEPELSAILEANHGPSIYDRLYSHPNAPDHKNDFDALLARIAPPDSEEEKQGKKKKDRNGLVRRGSRSSNPYKKHYVNGTRRSGSMYSGLSSEESAPEISRTTRYRGRACIGSSTDDEGKKKSLLKKKKVMDTKPKGKRGAPKKIDRKKKTPPKSKALIDSTDEGEDFKTDTRKDKSRSKTLQQLEKEMKAGKSGMSGTDSDDLMPMKISRNNKFPVDIYSDSSEEMSSTKHDMKSVKSKVKEENDKYERENPDQSPNGNDSQQSLPRTKAAMKEFIPSQSEKKSSPLEDKPPPKKRGRKPSNKGKKITLKSHDSDDDAKDKENIKFSKQKDNPTDLIVPQRQAAKKASENMRSTTKKEETVPDKPGSEDETKPKLKLKSKSKEKPSTVCKKPSKDADKETIAYVPQRQAAKKAAAHIKSGLGTKLPSAETSEIDKKKDTEKTEYNKVSPRKEDVKSKTPQKSSPSDSNQSNDSSACSSEEEEQGKRLMRPTAKAREIKPVTRQLFSPPGSRPTVDLPFLDKVSRPLSSTSASSDSESSKGSKYSGSSTPIPKRPRRRRKGKSLSSDSPRKAPDKKLKTSERGSECRVSSESIEGEKLRTDETRAATRSRTRSITASGNMLDKPGSRQRKPSKEDTNGPNKTPKEDSQSCKLSSPERKTDEEINKVVDEPPEQVNIDVNVIKNRRPSVMIEDKKHDLPSPTKSSPKKASLFKEIRNQNKRIKETKEVSSKEIEDFSEDIHSPPRKIRRPSILEPQPEKSNCTDRMSPPLKKPKLVEKPTNDLDMKKSVHINDDIIIDPEKDKHWFPKPPRPHVHPPPVEKPGDHEKYITEDKVLDLDSADKSGLKMIATIQANLNENTMIKSPKTPMDARTINMDNIDLENPIIRNKRKCSNLDPENKFIAHDSSHVQGVEISKSAKIPSAMSQFPNRSMLSPQPKDSEFFELDMLPVDDGFNHDDMMKPFASYPEFFFKEDSKEQGVQETLNLVDRLRMQLTKKVPTDNTVQDGAVAINDDLESKDEDKISDKSDVEMSSNEQIKDSANNHLRPDLRSESLRDDNKELHPVLDANNDHISIPDDSQSQPDDRKYSQGREDMYNEEAKDSSCVHLDNKSISTTADTISISKQSDDSQSISVVDHSVPSNDPDLTQDNQHYENNNSVMNSDCGTIPSPPFCRESKWRESKITTRRSSASSTNSDGSVCSRKTDIKSHMNSCDSHQGNVMPGIDSYPPIPAYSCPVEPSMPLNQYSTYPPDASPFLTTMGTLFAAGACASSQLPLPSPGPALYGPNLAFPTPPLLPSLPKQAFPTLCAAFTSSSQNIALTTAMIAPPTPKTLDSPRDDTIDVTESDKYSIHVVSESSPSISVGSFNEASNTRTMGSSKLSLDSNDTSMAPVSEEKSPSQVKVSKLTKFPGKSPGKSPGISPKQSDAPKSSKRPSSKSNRGQRGRGRSKSRSHGVHNFDYVGNSIQSKLVGTVYDFNEEIANDGVDLKALRDRRKSVDIRDDRKSEISYKDSSRSPGVASPQSSKRIPQIDPKEAKPPSTHESQDAPPTSPSSKTSERGNFSQVQPVLPGPVDMRTYNPFDNPPPVPGDPYHSHLLAFASGTAEQQLMEIDEEVEKQLHSALMASKPKTGSPTVPVVGQAQNNQMGKETLPPQLPKVSLSDSRNQLKVKIKGPFLDANYSTSSTQPPVVQPPVPTHDTNPNILSSNSGVASSMTGSTNLRRMRKKELLRQYWTQDMNMDDPTNNATIGVVPPPVPPQPLARAVITIPKAVASMTSIPTREDYKNCDAPVEKKKRKVSTGPSRELRQLKVSMNDDIVDLTEPNNPGTPHKRRSRVCTTKPNRSNATSPLAPKLKIKIKSNVVQQVCEEFTQFRPPKKRLSSIPKPSLEDLRRESMKYRKMVMADFEKDEKKKCKSESKSDASKGDVRKKKDRKPDKNKTKLSESAPKLIIKIKREGPKSGPSDAVATAAAVVAEPAVDPFEYDPTAPDPLAIDPPSYGEASSAIRKKIRTAKVTPIRLKLSRSSQGSGYVMKKEGDAKTDNDDSTAGPAFADPTLSDSAPTDNIVTSPNLAEKKNEVR